MRQIMRKAFARIADLEPSTSIETGGYWSKALPHTTWTVSVVQSVPKPHPRFLEVQIQGFQVASQMETVPRKQMVRIAS